VPVPVAAAVALEARSGGGVGAMGRGIRAPSQQFHRPFLWDPGN